MFRWFPACGVGGIVKPFPFDKIKQPQSFAMVIHSAVEDLMDFPFIGDPTQSVAVGLLLCWGSY